MAKKHMEVGEGAWKFKRNRNGDEHITNCADGYINPKGREPNVLEIHHVLCVHACSDTTFPDDITDDEKKFIYACFLITDWNINGADNNIGLPKKWAYVQDVDNLTSWNGYPCHQVDHDIYLKAVEVYVTDEIWNKVKKAKKAEDCEVIQGENIVERFNTGSKKWKKFLTGRGKKYGGTKACLDYCLEEKKGAMDDTNWYIPFSMAAPGEDEARSRVKPKAKTKLQRLGLLAQAIV